MVTQLLTPTNIEIIYPESDGQPMADNTIQFRWITVIYYNLAWLFAKDPKVFVAGDLLWYPVKGNSQLRQAPDVMVVLGVDQGDRFRRKVLRIVKIGSGEWNCVHFPSHTTGHTVFRIQRLNLRQRLPQ